MTSRLFGSRLFSYSSLFILLTGIVANSLLLTSAGNPLRVAAALTLIALPGLAWIDVLLGDQLPLVRYSIGLGLSYVLVMFASLLLHYLPGIVALWQIVLILDGLIILALLAAWRLPAATKTDPAPWTRTHLFLLLGMVLFAAAFRFFTLGYSEFQGDEIKVLMPAAKALEGIEDALVFQRKKGPGEILLPMLLWRLTGSINEASARLPFAVAGLMVIVSGFIAGTRMQNAWVGLAAAGLLALNGFVLAFSRIVQYQTLVIWMSALAVYCAWRWRDRPQWRWMLLAVLMVTAGLLSHYDALIVIPVLLYVAFETLRAASRSGKRQIFWQMIVGGVIFLVGAGLFYVPYLLDPQRGQTGSYLRERLGDTLIVNRLHSFLRFYIFYNSFYFFALTSVLLIIFIVWAIFRYPVLRRLGAARYWFTAIMILMVIFLLLSPGTWGIQNSIPTAVLYFLLLVGAFLSPVLTVTQRSVVLWFSAAFLGYSFFVNDPRTHIYATAFPWMLLASLTLWLGWEQIRAWRYGRQLLWLGAAIVALVTSGYLYLLYQRQDVEYWQDWPESRSSLYWAPPSYRTPPESGVFGVVHRSGWKSIGALYDAGVLSGTYGSNEKPELPLWYAPGAVRTTEDEPVYYFIADDIIDGLQLFSVDPDLLASRYTEIGRTELENGKSLSVYSYAGTGQRLIDFNRAELESTYDRGATAAKILQNPSPQEELDVDFSGDVELTGYDLYRTDDRITLVLYWQGLENLNPDIHAFVHLEGGLRSDSPQGVWGQSDGVPGADGVTTYAWYDAPSPVDLHSFIIDPETPSATYAITVGLYNPEDGQRLDVLDAAGNPAGNFAILTWLYID